MTSGGRQRMDVIDITDDGSRSPRVVQKTTTIKKQSTVRQIQPRILNKGVTTAASSSPGMSSATKTTAITTIPHEDNSHIEKRCENPDCAAPTLISLVPTRSTPQFIHDPTVVSEPILVNGYTTVFEVGGVLAKISELAVVKGNDGKTRYKSEKPIYRIVPKSHAHIVNYVIIDAEGETLRKIKQNDPTTIKKLLESQKNSAEQLLEKLIGIKKNDGLPTLASVAPSRTTPSTLSTSKNLLKVASNNNNNNNNNTTTLAGMLTSAVTNTVPTITTPVIASVSSGVPQVAALAGTAIPSIAPAQVQATATTLERMQSELRELRETVKLLTEQKRPSTGSADETDPKKRKNS